MTSSGDGGGSRIPEVAPWNGPLSQNNVIDLEMAKEITDGRWHMLLGIQYVISHAAKKLSIGQQTDYSF